MEIRMSHVGRMLLQSLHLLLVFAVIRVHRVEAQPSRADTVRFLEQSTFGPTSELVAHVQDIGFEAFLDAQFAAPMTDYPELEFWPQRRPPAAQERAKQTTIHCTAAAPFLLERAVRARSAAAARGFRSGSDTGGFRCRCPTAELDARLSATALSQRFWQLPPVAL